MSYTDAAAIIKVQVGAVVLVSQKLSIVICLGNFSWWRLFIGGSTESIRYALTYGVFSLLNTSVRLLLLISVHPEGNVLPLACFFVMFHNSITLNVRPH